MLRQVELSPLPLNVAATYPSEVRPPDGSLSPAEVEQVIGIDGSPQFELISGVDVDCSKYTLCWAHNPSLDKPQLPEHLKGREQEFTAYHLGNKWDRWIKAKDPSIQRTALDAAAAQGATLTADEIHALRQALQHYDSKRSVVEQIASRFGGGPLMSDNATLHVPKGGVSIDHATSQITINYGVSSYMKKIVTSEMSDNFIHIGDRTSIISSCAAVIVKDNNGDPLFVFTYRTTRNEAQPGFFHLVGGVIAPRIENGTPQSPDATARVYQILEGELGIKRREDTFFEARRLGVMWDRSLRRTEFAHIVKVDRSVDDLFTEGPQGIFVPKLPPNREVVTMCIPFTPERLSDLLCARPSKESPPWVSTGLQNALLAGRTEFQDGVSWYKDTLAQYESMCLTLKS